MKVNMGNLDRGIRIIIAVIVAAMYWKGIITGTLAYVLLGLSAIFIITSLVSFCPLYTIFGLNSCKIKK